MASFAIRFRQSGLLAIFAALLVCMAPRESRAATPADPTVSPVIILGFVGGFVRRDDIVHDEVQLAARLRRELPDGVVVEIFENHDGDAARRRIWNLLDANRDGKLSPEEKRRARIILYGHSWGASEVVTLARRLEKDAIPVLLTVQVDSVSKLGQNDEIIPPNVAQAANFYQADGLLHGTFNIRPEDAARTRIIGNFRFNYADRAYACANYPWYAHIFMKAHTQIECDPAVWRLVESLIHTAIARPMENNGKTEAGSP